MTAGQAIKSIDELKPNAYSQSRKYIWLHSLDAQIKDRLIDTHELNAGERAPELPEEYDADTVLLVPSPYDSMYIHWLEAQIDYANNEYRKFNNSNSMFQADFSEYAMKYNRTHMPKGSTPIYY